MAKKEEVKIITVPARLSFPDLAKPKVSKEVRRSMVFNLYSLTAEPRSQTATETNGRVSALRNLKNSPPLHAMKNGELINQSILRN